MIARGQQTHCKWPMRGRCSLCRHKINAQRRWRQRQQLHCKHATDGTRPLQCTVLPKLHWGLGGALFAFRVPIILINLCKSALLVTIPLHSLSPPIHQRTRMAKQKSTATNLAYLMRWSLITTCQYIHSVHLNYVHSPTQHQQKQPELNPSDVNSPNGNKKNHSTNPCSVHWQTNHFIIGNWQIYLNDDMVSAKNAHNCIKFPWLWIKLNSRIIPFEIAL